MTRGLKFSTTTSACAASLRAVSRPIRDLMFRVTPRLLVFRYRNGRLMSDCGSSRTNGPMRRAGSPPPGRSTFRTSAPKSARSLVQYGPATWWVKSSTRTPSSAAWFMVRSGLPVWCIIRPTARQYGAVRRAD